MDFEVLFMIPGRVRIKLNSLYKNKILDEKIRSMLLDKGIYSIKPNMYTANVLVIYDSKRINLKEIIYYLQNSIFEEDYVNTQNIHSHSSINTDDNTEPGVLRKNFSAVYKQLIKLALKLEKIKYIKKMLIILSFIAVLKYNILAALVVIGLYYANKLLNSVFRKLFVSKISRCTKQKTEKIVAFFEEAGNNAEAGKIETVIRRIEIYSMIAGLLILFLTGNVDILLLAILLAQVEIAQLVNCLIYVCAYFNALKTNVVLNNIKKIRGIKSIDSVIIVDDNNFINEKIVEDLRERGILDIRVVYGSGHKQPYYEKLEADLGIKTSCFNSLKDGVFNEVCVLKSHGKRVALAGRLDNLFLPDKFYDNVDLTISFNGDVSKFKNFDIIILRSNYNIIGNTIDYIKFIHETEMQNQLLAFWIYVYCMFAIFSKSIAAVYWWPTVVFDKSMIYFNSLKPLKYKLNYLE